MVGDKGGEAARRTILVELLPVHRAEQTIELDQRGSATLVRPRVASTMKVCRCRGTRSNEEDQREGAMNTNQRERESGFVPP